MKDGKGGLRDLHTLFWIAKYVYRVRETDELLERVWGPEYVNDSHYLKVFVRRLRQKLGDDASQPRYIQTAWGVGYWFVGSDDSNVKR